MTNFEHKPWKKIVVHELVIKPISEIFKMLMIQTQMGNMSRTVRWCRGWTFFVVGMPTSVDVVKEQLYNDTVHWNYAMVSRYPEYKDMVELPGKIRVPFIDQTGNPTAESFVDWLEENFADDIARIDNEVKISAQETK